jgi:hypothetical protein
VQRRLPRLLSVGCLGFFSFSPVALAVAFLYCTTDCCRVRGVCYMCVWCAPQGSCGALVGHKQFVLSRRASKPASAAFVLPSLSFRWPPPFLACVPLNPLCLSCGFRRSLVRSHQGGARRRARRPLAARAAPARGLQNSRACCLQRLLDVCMRAASHCPWVAKRVAWAAHNG